MIQQLIIICYKDSFEKRVQSGTAASYALSNKALECKEAPSSILKCTSKKV
jgi:hypothetical protein